MQRIEMGTERWNAITTVAETLQTEGTLMYETLKRKANCSGEVAQRVMQALATEHAARGEMDPSAPVADADSTDDAFPALMEAEWDEQTARLKGVLLRGLRRERTVATGAHDTDLARFRTIEHELRVNLAAALEDVATYSATAAHVDELEVQVAALQHQVADVTTASAKAAADLRRQLDDAQGSSHVANSVLADAVEARIRAETDAQHFRGRAETAESEVTRLRAELLDTTVRAARLEGQLDGVRHPHIAGIMPLTLATPTTTETASAAVDDFAADE